jgi:hypothetical protein
MYLGTVLLHDSSGDLQLFFVAFSLQFYTRDPRIVTQINNQYCSTMDNGGAFNSNSITTCQGATVASIRHSPRTPPQERSPVLLFLFDARAILARIC